MCANLMTELGIQFVKAGTFYLADQPWKGKTPEEDIYASLKLEAEDFRKADETAYLVYSDRELKYVGEFTYNLEDRWLSGNYVNHHKSDEIEVELNLGRDVTLWLAIHPRIELEPGIYLNIGKSIEQEFLRKFDIVWNKRNKIAKWEAWREENCIPVSKITEHVN